jgi:hypothetical protein
VSLVFSFNHKNVKKEEEACHKADFIMNRVRNQCNHCHPCSVKNGLIVYFSKPHSADIEQRLSSKTNNEVETILVDISIILRPMNPKGSMSRQML